LATVPSAPRYVSEAAGWRQRPRASEAAQRRAPPVERRGTKRPTRTSRARSPAGRCARWPLAGPTRCLARTRLPSRPSSPSGVSPQRGPALLAPALLHTPYESALEVRVQRSSTAGEEEALAEGARRQGRHLGVLRLDAGARPALAAARDHREDGQGTRRATAVAPRRQVAAADSDDRDPGRSATGPASSHRAASPPGTSRPSGEPQAPGASRRRTDRPRCCGSSRTGRRPWGR